jgi:hypothetical protein
LASAIRCDLFAARPERFTTPGATFEPMAEIVPVLDALPAGWNTRNPDDT